MKEKGLNRMLWKERLTKLSIKEMKTMESILDLFENLYKIGFENGQKEKAILVERIFRDLEDGIYLKSYSYNRIKAKWLRKAKKNAL